MSASRGSEQSERARAGTSAGPRRSPADQTRFLAQVRQAARVARRAQGELERLIVTARTTGGCSLRAIQDAAELGSHNRVQEILRRNEAS